MTTIQRRSPVRLPGRAARTEERDNWNVVLEYANEGAGPHVIDLSHRRRWDLQDKNVGDISALGMAAIPEAPNSTNLEKGLLVNRMNSIQAAVLHLSGDAPEEPAEISYTDTSEVTACLALTGPNVFAIAEKLTELDLLDPQKKAPFLIQGPLSHVPCQITVLERDDSGSPFPEGKTGTILFTFSRGYGHDMTHAVMDAGEEFGLRPAGESKFVEKFEALCK